MMLQYGMGTQPSSWHVLEPKAVRFARVYWILGGNTHYFSGGNTLPLVKNRVYIFPTHVPYAMETDPENPLNCLFLHLDLRTNGLFHPVCIDLDHDEEFSHLMQVIRDGITADYSAVYLELLAQSFEALCLVKHLFEAVDPDTQNLMELIRKTYRSNIPLSELAEQQGYTTEAFIRVFRNRIGISPHQYAISLRMNDAVRLLATDMSLDDLAQSVGYSDGHSFAGAFRRYYGISPSSYRNLYAGYI